MSLKKLVMWETAAEHTNSHQLRGLIPICFGSLAET